MKRDSDEMTVKEVAARHRVNYTTALRWVQNGTLPARRLAGHRYVVRREDCEALLAPVEPAFPAPTRQARASGVERAVGELRARGLDVP